MSENKKREKIIHVDNLVIHAQNVEIKDAENIHIQANNTEVPDHRREDHVPARDPWGFFWGWPREESRTEEERESMDRENSNMERDPF